MRTRAIICESAAYGHRFSQPQPTVWMLRCPSAEALQARMRSELSYQEDQTHA